MIASPESLAEVQEAVSGARRVLPHGAGTKPALSGAPEGEADLTHLDLSALSGITEYDPAELTLTAQANTPLADLAAALSEHGQYLPFDPPLQAAGATLAGAVAAASSGPGAFRYGGVRDFVIGVALIDGTGRLVHGGGKVVKNAAGFDLPKLMVGSAGRLGVMVGLSVKVLPAPRATLELAFAPPSREAALEAMGRLGRGPVQLDALELDEVGRLRLRLGGAEEVLHSRARRLETILGLEPVSVEGADGLDPLAWMPAGSRAVRVVLHLAQAAVLLDTLGAVAAPVRLSLGGNLAWVAWPGDRPPEELDRRLTKLGLAGMALTGPPGPRPLLGAASGGAFATRIRAALDPDHRFLEL